MSIIGGNMKNITVRDVVVNYYAGCLTTVQDIPKGVPDEEGLIDIILMYGKVVHVYDNIEEYRGYKTVTGVIDFDDYLIRFTQFAVTCGEKPEDLGLKYSLKDFELVKPVIDKDNKVSYVPFYKA